MRKEEDINPVLSLVEGDETKKRERLISDVPKEKGKKREEEGGGRHGHRRVMEEEDKAYMDRGELRRGVFNILPFPLKKSLV